MLAFGDVVLFNLAPFEHFDMTLDLVSPCWRWTDHHGLRPTPIRNLGQALRQLLP